MLQPTIEVRFETRRCAKMHFWLGLHPGTPLPQTHLGGFGNGNGVGEMESKGGKRNTRVGKGEGEWKSGGSLHIIGFIIAHIHACAKLWHLLLQ